MLWCQFLLSKHEQYSLHSTQASYTWKVHTHATDEGTSRSHLRYGRPPRIYSWLSRVFFSRTYTCDLLIAATIWTENRHIGSLIEYWWAIVALPLCMNIQQTWKDERGFCERNQRANAMKRIKSIWVRILCSSIRIKIFGRGKKINIFAVRNANG